MDCGFAADSAAEHQWWNASRRSRQTAHRVFALLFLIAVVAQAALLWTASQGRPAGWLLPGLPLLLASLSAWEWHEAGRIERRLAKAAPPSARVWLTATLEAMAPLTGIAVLARVFEWRVALGGPPLIAACLIPLISVLRLDYRICAVQGAIASLGYLLLLGMAESSGGPFSGELLRLHLGKAMLLLLAGALAGFVADRNRRRLLDVIRESVERAAVQETLTLRTRDYQQAEERIGQKNEFISILSHDLRTPLDGVAGLAQLMARSPGQFSAGEIRKYADAIQDTARNLRELLDNIVAWAELRTSTSTRPQQLLLLADVTRSVARLFEPAFTTHQLQFELSVPETLTVIADPRGLAAVIRNLLSNAIKFTPPGGRVQIRGYEPDSAGPGMLALVIADSGVGLAASQRTDDSSPARQGIGLALVRQLLEVLNGRLELRSPAVGGTEAWVWLLRANETADRTGQAQTAPRSVGQPVH